MATITAALVKELRERTGAGMMECKKILATVDGDIEKAIEEMRKSGAARADKKAGRIAAEGVIIIKTDALAQTIAMVELNSETDFVSRGENFVNFANQVAERALAEKCGVLADLLALPMTKGSDQTIDEARKALIAQIGENINVRRVSVVAAKGGAVLGHYLHGSRIGVVVELSSGNESVAKDVAMHIAASKPVVVSPTDVPADLVAKEREIFAAQAEQSGKPAEIVAKMIDGRIKKFLDEVSLLGQPFVKDSDLSVGAFLTQNKASVQQFIRFEVGEGIEKQADNFVEEVMAQARGAA